MYFFVYWPKTCWLLSQEFQTSIHFVLVYNYVISKFLQIMILICFTEYSKLLVTIYTHFIIMLLLKNVAKNQWCMERKMLIELAFIFIYYYF